jgi:hypothetical protein
LGNPEKARKFRFKVAEGPEAGGGEVDVVERTLEQIE